MNWAQTLGPEVLIWVKAQLHRHQHPKQAYRVCLGLLNLQHSYPAERINQACAIAIREGLFKLKNIQSHFAKQPRSIAGYSHSSRAPACCLSRKLHSRDTLGLVDWQVLLLFIGREWR